MVPKEWLNILFMSHISGCNNCVPIVPIRRDWYSGKKPCWRLMLPLKAAYGTTNPLQSRSVSRPSYYRPG